MSFRSILAATLFASASFLPVSAWAMSQKPKVTVRFYTEGNSQDGSSFARPIKLQLQQREAFLRQMAEFSEKNIKSILPFRAADGTWGCTFQLDEQGRMRLEISSTESIGKAMVAFIGTKAGIHQVVDMVIDRPVTDGIVSIPLGITEGEMLVLRQQFPVMGEEKGKKKKKPEPSEPAPMPDSATEPDRRRTSQPPPKRSKSVPPGPEPVLPRLAD